MGKHHLSHTLRAVGRHIGDDDAPFASRLEIHHVIARCQDANILKVRQLFYLSPAKHHFVGQHDLCIGSSRHRLTGPRAVIRFHHAQHLQPFPAQIARIRRIAVKYYDLHNFFDCFCEQSYEIYLNILGSSPIICKISCI